MKAICNFTQKIQLEIEERNEMDTLSKAIVLTSPLKKCNLCGNIEKFGIKSNKDKEGNIYINVVCNQCYANSKLGQYKSGGYFWRDFEKYEKNSS